MANEMPELHAALRQTEIMFDDIWDETGNVVDGTKAIIIIDGVKTIIEIRPAVEYLADLRDLMGRVGDEIEKRKAL